MLSTTPLVLTTPQHLGYLSKLVKNSPASLAHFQQKCSRGFVPENAQIQTIRASNPAKSGSDFADDALGCVDSSKFLPPDWEFHA
jgi:hypothetical protein